MDNVVSGKSERGFSFMLFALINISLFAGLMAFLYLVLHKSVWAQWVNGHFVWRLVLVLAVMKLFNSFIEYFFHRYFLHKSIVGFLSYFYRSHTKHHNLTHIGVRRLPRSGKSIPYVVDEDDAPRIMNDYPITKPEQAEASFFPWYSFLVFGAIITLVTVPLQLFMPSYPWLIGGYAAILASLTLYEFVHAVEHWPLQKWNVLLEHRWTGAFWRKVYSFHLRHHAVIECNEAISGFFTLPIPDWVFGTFILPKSLYIDGGEWKAWEFTKPEPCRLIAWCDRFTERAMKRRRLKMA